MDGVVCPPGVQVFQLGKLEVKVMVSPLHSEVGPEIVTGAGAGRIVTVTVSGVPVKPQELDGVTVKV